MQMRSLIDELNIEYLVYIKDIIYIFLGNNNS